MKCSVKKYFGFCVLNELYIKMTYVLNELCLSKEAIVFGQRSEISSLIESEYSFISD